MKTAPKAAPLPELKSEPKTALPSDRSFGWLFTGVFAVAGLFFHPALLALAAVMAVATLVNPGMLAPLNRAWMRFGAVLHRIVSPVVMGVLYFGLFTPMGFAMRLFGWDAMKRTWNPAAKSYWTRREPAGPSEDSFRNLF